MSIVSEILEFNEQFVKSGEYKQFQADVFPDKKLVILTCMDTRLVELLPHAMNLRNGDAKMVKNAGAIVTHPFGSAMRSILVALYELKASEVAVIGHHECGMTGLNGGSVLEKAKTRGVMPETLATLESAGLDLKSWLTGFKSPEDGVRESVTIIRNHPLLPKGIPVHGLMIHPRTGKLDLVCDGYASV